MKYKQMCKRLFGVFCALLLLVAAIGGQSVLPAFAATSSYTSSLEDLQKDSEFNVNDYPDNAGDHSIQVIQIAESTGGELFIYTYQPCQVITPLTAIKVNMSFSERVNGTNLYGLTLLNSDGVFCKYKVDDIAVSEDYVRYYNITSIYRKWIEGIDEETGNDNTKDMVSFAVGKCFRAETENEVVYYSCKVTEVIEINNPVAGYLEYSNGFKFCPDWCDSHYVAFSTDKKIDNLMEADVSFVQRKASQSIGLGLDGHITYGDPENLVAELNGTQTGGNAGDGWFGQYYKFEWDRIESIETFINEVGDKLSDEARNKLNGAQWVLRFVETTRTAVTGPSATSIFWTDISEVTVLRLKFIANGKVYNLGAVSDAVSEPDHPDNPTVPIQDLSFWQYVWNCVVKLFDGTATLSEQIVAIVAIFLVVLALPILLTVLSVVFPAFRAVLGNVLKVIGKGFLLFFKGLWWLICLPFKGIAALVRKIRGE